MPGSLTDREIDHYRETGQLRPAPALTSKEADYFRGRLEAVEVVHGMPPTRTSGQVRAKTHLLFTWMDTLIRHSRVLDAVESSIGPDILVYHLTCWLKGPHDGTFVTWHQDGT